MNHSKGLIDYFELTDWWLSTFTPEERAYIESQYGSDLTETEFYLISDTKSSFLADLCSHFYKIEDQSVWDKIMAKLESIGCEVIDLHFLYHRLIINCYKLRDQDPLYFEKAIEACKKQIELAPEAAKVFKRESSQLPSHKGYVQLTIIYEKENRWEDAIELCKEAQRQGWNDDWDNRIQRLEKKLHKRTNK